MKTGQSVLLQSDYQ